MSEEGIQKFVSMMIRAHREAFGTITRANAPAFAIGVFNVALGAVSEELNDRVHEAELDEGPDYSILDESEACQMAMLRNAVDTFLEGLGVGLAMFPELTGEEVTSS